MIQFNRHPLHRADRSLARRMIHGEEKAIVEFMDTYFPRLYRFALVRMNDDPSGAEDVVQQTLTIAARKISTFRGEASLMTWLVQICRRELMRQVQKNKRRDNVISLFDEEPLFEAILENLEGDDPLDFTERAELMSMVHLVLDQLPNRNGDVLEWKYIDGLSIKEIAERLGIGSEAVQSQLARARRAFKEAFTDFHSLYYS